MRLLPLLLLLAACATAPAPGGDPADPFEPTNRQILRFNEGLDEAVIRPAAEAYRAALPAPVRTGIRNVLNNLNQPVIFTNNVLQARFLDAGQTLMRFYINTTAGLMGIFDVATLGGATERPADFGQTLHVYGVPDGPYLMLPVVGPAHLRDAVGQGVDSLANPVGIAGGLIMGSTVNGLIGVGRGVIGGLDLRAENIENLDALRADSLDFYARLRSVVRQRRDAELGRTSADTGTVQTLDDPDAALPGAGPLMPVPLDDPGEAPAATQPGEGFSVFRAAPPGAAGQRSRPQ
ncbi:MlaA family lipoprotein [Sabulicella glaciei]|uniref:VacJ family lipoprotein n=1 Tax=Sabulicella glaciei TaxID=2984948 RepID=A0ABT3NUI1_9PROT|nr:VacJ family lipoprotein [Roseococcus sp. MDT2-1-1]MCW8085816.1 VacJ family lipoprotein [Roseococcus sp. MDT2-1-1]